MQMVDSAQAPKKGELAFRWLKLGALGLALGAIIGVSSSSDVVQAAVLAPVGVAIARAMAKA